MDHTKRARHRRGDDGLWLGCSARDNVWLEHGDSGISDHRRVRRGRRCGGLSRNRYLHGDLGCAGCGRNRRRGRGHGVGNLDVDLLDHRDVDFDVADDLHRHVDLLDDDGGLTHRGTVEALIDEDGAPMAVVIVMRPIERAHTAPSQGDRVGWPDLGRARGTGRLDKGTTSQDPHETAGESAAR
jgi:hypothetical protein